MSAFSPAFLRGDAQATAFLPDDFRRAASRAAAVRLAGNRRVSTPVLAALTAQNARWPSAERARALQSLGVAGSVAVVTGQQVGLFLGPLFTLYKAATAVETARALSAETGVACVPVFWLQSEDHDFAEINHVSVHGREGAVTRLELNSPHVARASVSTVALGGGVSLSLAALRSVLDGLSHAEQVCALFERHYRPEASWVTAFAGVLAELFPELVLLDPRDEAIAAAVRPIHDRALSQQAAICEALTAREHALESAGFDVQVPVRDAPLTFVHPSGRDGPRYRGATCDLADPLCVSSSALLRPIIQDTLLPTAAMICGPGELNYFAQLAPLYAHFDLPMPMVMPRARFRAVEPRARALLAELGLSSADVERPRDELLKRVVRPAAGPTSAELEARLVAAVDAVLRDVSGVEDAVLRTQRTVARAAERFALRHQRAQLTRDGVLVARVDRLQQALFPGQAPQERVLGLAGFAARCGLDELMRAVRDAITPFGVEVKELSL